MQAYQCFGSIKQVTVIVDGTMIVGKQQICRVYNVALTTRYCKKVQCETELWQVTVQEN